MTVLHFSAPPSLPPELAPAPAEIAPEERGRPLGYLRLGLALERILSGSPSLGVLLRAVRMGTLPSEALTPGRRADLADGLRILRASLREGGEIDWLHFAGLRPVRPNPHELYLVDTRWNRLAPKERALSAGALHLRRKTMTCLATGGIETLGGLLIGVESGLHGLHSTGIKTFTDVEAALTPLGPAVQADGRIDWLAYARARGFPILPHAPLPVLPPKAFLRRLASVLRQILKINFPETHQLIVGERYLRFGEERPTGQTLADPLGISRERARQMEEEVFTMLRAIFLRGDYRGARFRLREEIVAPVRQLAACAGAIPPHDLTLETWSALIAERWGAAASRSIFARLLLPRIAGVSDAVR